MVKRIIDFETHSQTPSYLKLILKFKGFPIYGHDAQGHLTLFVNSKILNQGEFLDKLDNPERRIKDMENAGIDLQVTGSSNPGCELFPPKMSVRLSKINNDHLAGWIAKYPDKFVALGSLPMQDSDAALEEFDRIWQLGFRGLILFSNIRKKFVDFEEFWPLYARAAKCSFPIFLHPGTPVHADTYSVYNLWGPVFGFGVDRAHAALRLIMSGVFEQYPKLTIVLGHLGETIPFFPRRMDKTYLRDPQLLPKIKKRPSEYFLDNFTLTPLPWEARLR